MGLFGKTKDPMASREEALEREIAQLQRKIADLSTRPLPAPKPAPARPASVPSVPAASSPFVAPTSSQPVSRLPSAPIPAPRPAVGAPIPMEGAVPPHRYNLAEAWDRLKSRLAGRPRPPSGLVNLMAAGSVHGLRPLRYERKIARRRFLLSLSFLLLVLYGIARVIFRDGF